LEWFDNPTSFFDVHAADGFIVQTGDPPGTADGFVEPGTGKVRTIPLEIMVEGDQAPIYGATLEVRPSVIPILTSLTPRGPRIHSFIMTSSIDIL
jgi:hypothetical protein